MKLVNEALGDDVHTVSFDSRKLVSSKNIGNVGQVDLKTKNDELQKIIETNKKIAEDLTAPKN